MITHSHRHVSICIEEVENCTLDKLVIRASRGDCRAIESVAALYAPRLALEAGISLGTCEQAPEELVEEFMIGLMDAVPRRRLARSLALPWMLRVLRSVAGRYRRRRAGDWRVGSADP